MKIIFWGSADFGIPALKQLIDKHQVCAVVSTPPRPQGRGLVVRDSPIVAFSRTCGITEIHTPTDLKAPELVGQLASYNADLFVVVAFRILPRTLFALPPLGTINIHASLLPRYRGPAPIQRAIEAGETETGVTIFRIDDGVDTGDILLQKKIPIGPEDTTPVMYSRLSVLGSEALMEAIDGLSSGTLVPAAQHQEGACGAPKLRKEEALIDWRTSSKVIFNKIRAFKPFPGTYTQYNDKRLGIVWAYPLGEREAGDPGTIIRVERESFDVLCAEGVLRVVTVKPEGRTEMSVRDFLHGHALRKGTVFS